MSHIAFEQMTKTKGGLMSFNNFLSTSKDRKVSLDFAYNAIAHPDSVGILFVMTIDPSKSTTPFASVANVSYYKIEEELLFSMHTVFRIHDIQPLDENDRLFQVNITLKDDNDKDLCALTDCIREETDPTVKGWYRLGSFLLNIDQSSKAEQVYNVLLDQATDETQKAPIYHQIGWAKLNQGKYKDAILYYEKSIKIGQQFLPPNHPDLAQSYNNMGNTYNGMGEYSKALSHYEKALENRQQC